MSLFVLNVGNVSMLLSVFLFGNSTSLTYSGLTFVIGLIVPPHVLAKVIRSLVCGSLNLG